ncbi:nitrate reductase [Nitratireductor luteus]|uniref:nitrate reductase n=1 Tax=Nitratireductor luteus TaxID=2976980 RepID=UPI00223FC0A8|nr:nitrate reductase [Nitratireductor luteus]
MSSFANLFAPRPRRSPAESALIKKWLRTRLGLEDEVVVSVSQITCREPGCPDVETVIGILRPGQSPQAFRIERPMVDVTEDDVARVVLG